MLLQENLSSSSTNNFQQETAIGSLSHQVHHWRPEKLLFSSESSNNNNNEFKQRGFSLDQNQTTQFSPQYSSGDSNVTSQGLLDSTTALYGNNPSILQGLLGPDHQSNNNQPQHHGGSFENRPMINFPYPATISYGLSSNINELMPSWSNSKVPQFLRASPPKQQQPNNQLHFTNNAPFWNASEATTTIKDARSSFFPSSQTPFATPNFDAQSKV